MTESEWLECTDPKPMLEFLRGKASERKLRLFACASCQSFSQELDDPWSRKVVEVALEVADDEARIGELGSLDTVARQAARSSEFPNVAWAVADLTLSNPWHAAVAIVRRHVIAGSPVARAIAADIVGNPFRTIALNPAWQSPTILALAQAAYDNRTLPAGTLEPTRLAVLADALEEAGCANPDILNHLRGPGEHVRGCWLLDLLLGKE
jgi:hypothetical protein